GLTNRLITTAFACLAEIEEPVALGRMIRRLNAAVAETVSGQTSELTRKAHEEPSVESCIAAARQKSGPLFALALELPLIMAGQEKHVGTAHRVACLLGLGYQMLDDLKDQTPDSAHASSGNLVLAMRRANPARSAEQAVASLARTCLSDAIKEAEKLPGGMGRPLIEWTQSLFPRINTFT
ncbi:MAG: polyprenyl synthetase family protein, partial [Opitutales bacterium]